MTNSEINKQWSQCAEQYDTMIYEAQSFEHEALFGMCYEYIKPDQTLLDLGAGTGLSSIHFAQAGMSVSCMDASEAMLDVCRRKGFAKDIKEHNLEEPPLPYADASFDVIICTGVLHAISDLAPVFAEMARIIIPNGICAITTQQGECGTDITEFKSPWVVDTWRHSDNYVHRVAKQAGFTLLKYQQLVNDYGDARTVEPAHPIFVMRKG